MPDHDPVQQPLLASDDEESTHRHSNFKTKYNDAHRSVQAFLSSRVQHWLVLGLVTFDVLGIFADIFINLYQCEEGDNRPFWNDARDGLGIAGLVFSCLFMAELIMSVWAFGWSYFNTWFHCFDAAVILAGFIIDVVLKGIVEEVASLVVILRLWRFFKIIEEFSVGAEEQMDGLELRIEQLEQENSELKKELRRQKGTLDEEEEIGLQGGSNHH